MTLPVRMLIVEDNEADAFLISETLDAEPRRCETFILRDGAEACAYIAAVDRNAARPDLIMLDINLPKLDGFAVLSAIRRHDALREVPVVMLSSSDAPGDVTRSYELGANCYVTKPVGLAEFQTKLGRIEQFWSDVATLP